MQANASSHGTGENAPSGPRSIGVRRRSGSSCSSARLTPFGHKKPWLKTSCASPRIRDTPPLTVISSPHVASQRGQVRIAVRGSPMKAAYSGPRFRSMPSEGRRTRLIEQRKSLPKDPGVYLFRDAQAKVIYVGKAKNLRNRVAGHFSNPVTRGAYEMVDAIESVEYLLLASETEALLAEQNFIKQYRPRFNIRLRDDKSYPFIAISTDEAFPRVYFTRERHRANRVYFGPYSNAKRTRATIETLGKIFLFRSCNGPEPGRRSGSPCLDYYIKRCGAPCVGYVDEAEYRKAVDGVIAFLSGRYREIERALEEEMRLAAEEQDYEHAALTRNRL